MRRIEKTSIRVVEARYQSTSEYQSLAVHFFPKTILINPSLTLLLAVFTCISSHLRGLLMIFIAGEDKMRLEEPR